MKQFHLTNLAIADLCGQVALLLKAGIPLGEGLYLLAEDETAPEHRKLLTAIAGQIEDGALLNRAFALTNAFPDYVTGLLQIGEQTGRTEETLLSLSKYYENRDRLEKRLRSTLTYPAILLLLIFIVIIVLLTRVLPIFDDVYASLGGHLTGLAGGLLILGRFLDVILPFLCILLGIFIAAITAISLSAGLRDGLTSFCQRHWGHKGISRKINDARFAQALAMTLSSGLPLEDAISLAASLLVNDSFAHMRCEDCLARLHTGEDLAAALSASDLLPSTCCKMLSLGLRTGAGDSTMAEIAERLTEEAQDTLERRIAVIEPALVIVTSLLVGAILLSVMLPLMNIMKAIG